MVAALCSCGTTTLTDCTISGNSCGAAGGGVSIYGISAILTDCTVSGNTAAKGGGLYNAGTARLDDCTVSGNTAAKGGGLENTGTATLTGCTVSGNTAHGGGLEVDKGAATLNDTIVAGNSDSHGASDVAGAAVAGVTGANDLIGSGGSGGIAGGSDGDIVLTSLAGLGLAPLANNGGPTQTMALLPGSPAINAGRNALDVDANGNFLATDQRGPGFPRVVGGTADMGAYESTYLTTATSLASPGGATSSYGQPVTFTATVVVIDGGAGMPTGSVEFFDGTADLGHGTALAAGGAGATSTLTLSTLGVATHDVEAVYSATGAFLGNSSGLLSHTVDEESAAVVLASSAGSAVYGQVVTFTATVSGAAGGTITFSDGGVTLGSVALDGSGRAVLTTAALATGLQSITAAYGGDAVFAAATSRPTSVSVARAGSQVVLVPHAALKKKKVVSLGLEARIKALAPGGGVPTGTVTFELKQKKKVKVLGTASLVAGEATLAVKTKGVLNKPITILYGGDSDFQASTVALTLAPSSLTTMARPMVSFPWQR